jgi:hypothetical protein
MLLFLKYYKMKIIENIFVTIIALYVGMTILSEIGRNGLYEREDSKCWIIEEENRYRQTYEEYVEERLRIERMMR